MDLLKEKWLYKDYVIEIYHISEHYRRTKIRKRNNIIKVFEGSNGGRAKAKNYIDKIIQEKGKPKFKKGEIIKGKNLVTQYLIGYDEEEKEYISIPLRKDNVSIALREHRLNKFFVEKNFERVDI